MPPRTDGNKEREWVVQMTKIVGENDVRWQVRGGARSAQGRSASRAAAVREVNAIVREFGIDEMQPAE